MKAKFANVLSGIAVGDAIGNPLEFKSNVSEDDFIGSLCEETLYVSDDTQMTLFLSEALLKGYVPLRSVEAVMKLGYLSWYQTQSTYPKSRKEGLMTFLELYRREAPGSTCMSSLSAMSVGKKVVNDSKGNGTVMRCSPIAYYGLKHGIDIPDILRLAELDATMTHKHPYAAQSSMFLVSMHLAGLRGENVKGAYKYALQLTANKMSAEILEKMNNVQTYGGFHEHVVHNRCFVAEDALVAAIGAVLHAESYVEAICNAIAIGGDSDTVGGIAGGLAVYNGFVPDVELVNKLNVIDALNYVKKLL